MAKDSKTLTISDIANELGIAKSTVSRAISGKGRIGKETKNRILAYIEENDYRPNAIAKSLAEKKTFNIGVVLPADSNMSQTPFFQTCLMGICEVASSRNYDVTVITDSELDISNLKRVVQNNKVDGFVLTRSVRNSLAMKYLKKEHIPFVLIGSTEGEDVVQIDSDHEGACAELTSILLRSGNHTIAILSGSQEHIVNRTRYQGYRKAFYDSGVPLREELVFLDMNNQTLIEQAVEKIMTCHTDCIVCTDDLICGRVLAKLQKEHYRIPKSVRVASFYSSVILECYDPPITSINMNPKHLGIVSGNMLMKLINGESVTKKTLVDYEIVLKKSTM